MFKILIICLCVKFVLPANILYACSIPSPSHHIWNRALALGLVSKGHNVTLIDPDLEKLPKPANYNHVQLQGVYETLNLDYSINDMATLSPSQMLYEFQDWSLVSCNLSLQTKEFRDLLKYSKDFKFDLIIIDVTAGSCYYPLIHYFNYPPTIAVTAFLLPSYVSYNMGNGLYPTYVPWYGLPYTTEMTFMERVWNFVYAYFDIIVRYKRQYHKEHELTKKFYEDDIPPMKDLEDHISLVLANTDPILDHPQPLAPNFIPVGGLHTRKSNNLPQDLRKLLDDAKDGVIIFSLGTNLRSDKLDDNTKKALLDAFSQLPQLVIWKFESDIANLPNNVITRKWLPQNDVLGHPNVKLFIGHGGALSTQEAMFHGVPMIGVPFIVDQHINTRIIVKKKLGLSLDFRRLSTNYVLETLKEVLNNPIYSENMRKISIIYKDRMETPLDRAVFWAEYAMRYDGAKFLNTPARHFPFYKALGLDVMAFLVAAIIVLFYILKKLSKVFIHALVNRRKRKTE